MTANNEDGVKSSPIDYVARAKGLGSLSNNANKIGKDQARFYILPVAQGLTLPSIDAQQIIQDASVLSKAVGRDLHMIANTFGHDFSKAEKLLQYDVDLAKAIVKHDTPEQFLEAKTRLG